MPLSPMITKLNSFRTLSNTDNDYLVQLGRPIRDIRGDVELLTEGERLETAYVLVEGWTCCYKLLADGRRQIVNFGVPGDFMGLRSVLFHESDHSFGTLSHAKLYELSRSDIRDIFENQPQIALGFLWAMARDEAIIVEHLVRVGRRSAKESLVHMMVELLYRLKLVGLAEGDGFDCRLTQHEIADALGLSVVHVNRLLRQLREDRLLTFRDSRVIVHDVDRLIALGGYDPAYLDHQDVEI